MPHCCGTDGVGATSQGSGRLWLLEEPGGESPRASRRGAACHNPVSPQGDCAGRLTQRTERGWIRVASRHHACGR